MLQKRVFTRHKRFLHCLPPRWGGITHISQKKCFVALFLTASPSREKPLVDIFTWFLLIKNVGYGTRLLPSGRSCQPPALRNRGLTDVGHRRRRQRYPFPCLVDLRRNKNILDIFGAYCKHFCNTPPGITPRYSVCNVPASTSPAGTWPAPSPTASS